MINKSKKIGLAALTKEKRQEIASKGGRAAHIKGTAHEFSSTEAKIAGRKGGKSKSGKAKSKREPGDF